MYVHFAAHMVPMRTTPAASELVYVLFVLDVVGELLPLKIETLRGCSPTADPDRRISVEVNY